MRGEKVKNKATQSFNRFKAKLTLLSTLNSKKTKTLDYRSVRAGLTDYDAFATRTKHAARQSEAKPGPPRKQQQFLEY